MEYAKAVKMWCAFHDNLPDGNSNKISKLDRGIVLQSNFYGRAKDLCDSLDIDVVSSENGVTEIVNII